MFIPKILLVLDIVVLPTPKILKDIGDLFTCFQGFFKDFKFIKINLAFAYFSSVLLSSLTKNLLGLMVRTIPFHGINTGSIPVASVEL